MAEDIKEIKSKKEEKNVQIDVVEQLPMQPFRKGNDEKGIEHHFITRDEAIAEILEIVRAIKKGLV